MNELTKGMRIENKQLSGREEDGTPIVKKSFGEVTDVVGNTASITLENGETVEMSKFIFNTQPGKSE